MAAYQHPIFDC